MFVVRRGLKSRLAVKLYLVNGKSLHAGLIFVTEYFTFSCDGIVKKCAISDRRG